MSYPTALGSINEPRRESLASRLDVTRLSVIESIAESSVRETSFVEGSERGQITSK